ncbi:geminin coiled-coil domain-containing protein 1 [Esox lucius]|uniref:Geminin coiled-coil domain containing n=1 Tax=Esox lucius TaxID=8010 RepID=A0AAY5JVY7_ESOLU|nr:geminin coiled-coil domain-containing protein 1 [Esox lucius]
MSTVLTCQDLSFVGGQIYDCPYPFQTSADSVDVSTVTLASFLAAGSPDDTVCQHESTQREINHLDLDFGTSPTDQIWTDQLSPHLQRNKQLQDTLLQREEELARLHEENFKLKEFLNSSFVKTLDEKRKRLLSAQSGDWRRKRKRNSEIQNLHGVGEFWNLSASQLLLGSQGKRTCRNVSLEFCSEEELASTPPVDLWILQTLGLKDEDTIDTSSNEYNFNSSINSLTESSSSTDSSGDCQTSDHKITTYDSCCDSHGHGCSIGLSNNYYLNTNSEFSVTTVSNFTGNVPFVNYNPSIEITPNFKVIPYEHPLPQLVNPLSSADPIQPVKPILDTTPNLLQDRSPKLHHTPSSHCHSTSNPIGADVPSQYLSLSMPRSPKELAFSMSLNSSSSVRLKTHSFPQGQAFVRKDTQGGWNFTWVPKQGN